MTFSQCKMVFVNFQIKFLQDTYFSIFTSYLIWKLLRIFIVRKNDGNFLVDKINKKMSSDDNPGDMLPANIY